MDTPRQVMQDYLDALVKRADFSSYFASDVVATIEGTDQRADGPEAAEQMIRYFPLSPAGGTNHHLRSSATATATSTEPTLGA